MKQVQVQIVVTTQEGTQIWDIPDWRDLASLEDLELTAEDFGPQIVETLVARS
jgi:hypothetical protein